MINVYVNATRDYYNSVSATSVCDCAYCKNYYAQIEAEYPEVVEYLDALGVDIKKPLETSPLEPNEDGILEYCCCQYIVLGYCDSDYRNKIGEVEFCISSSYPCTGIDTEHFVLEFFPIKLKIPTDLMSLYASRVKNLDC